MKDELDWLTGTESRRLSPDGKMFAAYGAARQMFFSQSSELLIEGPAGTGKTRPALEKLHRLALRYPACRLMIVRKTRHSMTQSVMVTFENKVLPRDAQSGKLLAPFHSGDQAYRYPNGSIVAVAGIDNAAKILSSEWDVIYAAEATELTENDFEMLGMRLRNGVIPYQQLLADCNPGPPTHWLNRRAERGQTQRLLSRHADNPTVTADYLKRLSELTGVRRLRYFEGRWAAAEGLVYPEFDPAVHMEYKRHIPAQWTRYRVVDFGFQHSFVCQWWAIDPDGNAHLYRELYGTQRLVEDWAKDIKRITEAWREHITATITDHDAEGRATLEKYLEIETVPAKKDVAMGIQLVKSRLRVKSNGKPGLYFMYDSIVTVDPLLLEAKHPTHTVEEFDSYVWEIGRDGQAKEVPVKRFDDGLDSARYLVSYLDGPDEYDEAGDPMAGGELPAYQPEQYEYGFSG